MFSPERFIWKTGGRLRAMLVRTSLPTLPDNIAVFADCIAASASEEVILNILINSLLISSDEPPPNTNNLVAIATAFCCRR